MKKRTSHAMFGLGCSRIDSPQASRRATRASHPVLPSPTTRGSTAGVGKSERAHREVALPCSALARIHDERHDRVTLMRGLRHNRVHPGTELAKLVAFAVEAAHHVQRLL